MFLREFLNSDKTQFRSHEPTSTDCVWKWQIEMKIGYFCIIHTGRREGQCQSDDMMIDGLKHINVSFRSAEELQRFHQIPVCVCVCVCVCAGLCGLWGHKFV